MITLKHPEYPDFEFGNNIMTTLDFYQKCKELFDDEGMMQYKFPMVAATPTIFELINDYYLTEESYEYLTSGSICRYINTGYIFYNSILFLGFDDFKIEHKGKIREKDTLLNLDDDIFLVQGNFKYKINDYIRSSIKMVGYIHGTIVIPIPSDTDYSMFRQINKKLRKEKIQKLSGVVKTNLTF